MVCDICQKTEATVHLTEIINNKVAKMHLCEKCAKEKGEEMETHFGLSDLLSGLADFKVPQEIKEVDDRKCATCGFTLNDFQRAGRFGCPKCYDSFKGHLTPLLKHIHGSDVHVGKIPPRVTVKGAAAKSKTVDPVPELRDRLKKAVIAEEFEEAAVLRDRIKELENKREKKK